MSTKVGALYWGSTATLQSKRATFLTPMGQFSAWAIRPMLRVQERAGSWGISEVTRTVALVEDSASVSASSSGCDAENQAGIGLSKSLSRCLLFLLPQVLPGAFPRLADQIQSSINVRQWEAGQHQRKSLCSDTTITKTKPNRTSHCTLASSSPPWSLSFPSQRVGERETARRRA